MIKSFIKYGLGVLLILQIASCQRREVVTPESEDTGGNLYQIVPGGELTSTKAFPASALYVLTVFAEEGDPVTVAATEANRYAHGVFSDPMRMYVRMDPGYKYRIQLKAIINGESAVYHEGAYYEGMGTLNNRPRYFDADPTEGNLYMNTANGAAREIHSGAVSAAPALDTFFGETLFVPMEPGHKQINMQVSRCSFGLRLEVTGLSEEDNPLGFTYTVDEASFSVSIPAVNPLAWEIVRTLPNLSAAAAAARLAQSYSITSMVNLHYATVINDIPYESDIIKDRPVNFYRNVRTTLKAHVERHFVETFEDGITLVVEDAPLGDNVSGDFDGEVDTDTVSH